MSQLSIRSRIYLAATVIAGALVVSSACWNQQPVFSLRFAIYLLAALAACSFRVTLPGITGTMSVNFVFTLISIVDLPLWEVLLVTWAGILGQAALKSKLWNGAQIVFNLASITISAGAAYGVYHSALARSLNSNISILLLLSATALFLANTLSVSGIIALTERKGLWRVWHESFAWTASQYLVGAGLTVMFHSEEKYFGWEAVVLTAPVIYLVYRSYSLHLSRLEVANAHAMELGGLHWRAIEALALAIDAKDQNTHSHLLRVRVYATEVAREMNLSKDEMDAVQAASLLHDIGKLAVPEYIISKPGKLTPEEFEKMKVHPAVGAEILERVRFPYPVVPMVRSHHEKWNGKGYPDGLKGEEIPIGARILSAVDCLDALASDRPYRRALPLDKAMEIIVSESGTSFDPRVVEILGRRYVELEQMATAQAQNADAKLSTDVKFERGDAPAAGFEQAGGPAGGGEPAGTTLSIAAARHEFRNLFKLTDELAGSLGLEETAAVIAARLNRIVSHDTFVVYVVEANKLVPKYVGGEERGSFSGLEIPVGEGLSGWVVEHNVPILNGNASVEPFHAGAAPNRLRSALSVPLVARGEVMGALSLYSARANHFTKDQLGVLQAVSAKMASAIADAREYERAALSSTTDEVTGLPNACSLFAHIEERLKSSNEEKSHFALILIDMNRAGAEILQRAGNALAANCPPTDYMARLGDEFVIVTSDAVKSSVDDRLRSLGAIANREEISLRVGASFYPADGVTTEALLEAAERNLNEQKQKPPKIRAA